MPGTALPLEDAIAHSPRLYAFPFKSTENRFKSDVAERESTNLFYEINNFDTVTKVNQSPRKFAHVFRKPKEGGNETVKVDVPVYNTDCGSNKTLNQTMLDSTRRYGFNLTDSRFKDDVKRVGDVVYDVNTLHKAGVEKRVEQSPIKYSQMKSKVPRDFGSAAWEVHGDYNPKNYELETLLEQSPRRYTVLSSRTPRDMPTKMLHPAVYNTDVLHKTGIATEAKRKPGCVSTFKASPRKPPRNDTCAPDKVYNTECGNKKSMWNELLDSPRLYSNMAHSSRVDQETLGPVSKHLLYNTENTPVKPTLAYEVLRTPRLYSNMASATPRFQEVVASAAQAVYDPDSAPRGEGSISKRIKESQRRYFGAQSMTSRSMVTGPEASRNLQYELKYSRRMDAATVADSLKNTPLQYSNVRSLIPRFKAEKKAATMDEYEQLLRNPDRIDLKFQIRGNIVVKKTSDRAMLVVGRQAPAPS